MEITKDTRGDAMIYRLDGRLDASTSRQFDEMVTAAIPAGCHRIALDMRALSYISSAGLRAVLVAAKQAKAAKGAVVLFGLQNMTREVFEMSGFGRIMRIVAAEDDALAALDG